MEKESFSLLLPNLFIGLCKGSKILGRYSQTFGRELGFSIFQFEPSFKISEGRVNPDAILTSGKTGNTLILEWTEECTISERKKNQLSRYDKVLSSDLIQTLAIPVNFVDSFDTLVITSKKGLDSFQEFCIKKDYRFPLLFFTKSDNNYKLELRSNSISEHSTHEFFQSKIETERIPTKYLPFSLEDITLASLSTFVGQHLVSLLVKEKDHFNITEFCEGFVPTWEYLDIQKQRDIKNKTKEILGAFIRNPRITQPFLEKIANNPPTWQFIQIGFLQTRIPSIKAILDIEVQKLKGSPYQQVLPFSSTN